jgi:hypothetical protein
MHRPLSRSGWAALAGIAVAAALAFAAAVPAATRHAHLPAAVHSHASPAHAAAGATAARTASVQRLHDAMRKLWEDHITWTRLAIVSFAAGLPDLPATEARLLRNQADIRRAIAPFYGRKAGRRLTALLREHIRGAVALLQAAKAGDDAAVGTAKAAWYRNGNQVADFLSAANPAHWPRRVMRSMMKEHLDETLKEAVDRLSGRFAADVRDYEAVHRHILVMADALSDGIVAHFPRRFR